MLVYVRPRRYHSDIDIMFSRRVSATLAFVLLCMEVLFHNSRDYIEFSFMIQLKCIFMSLLIVL